jgi:hypothetical protein
MKNGWQVLEMRRRSDNGFVIIAIIGFGVVTPENEHIYHEAFKFEYNGIDDTFINFEDLTEETVLNWCFEKMGEQLKTKMENRAIKAHQDNIDNDINRAKYSKGLPF